MKIGIANDHRGYDLKEKIKEKLEIDIIDFGTNSIESVDYPDYAFMLGEAVRDKKVDLGIAICGSGIGISIACNKVRGVRCARVVSAKEAKITKIDNNSNIIALSANLTIEEALEIIETFLNTEFKLDERHMRRIKKISEYEINNGI